MNMYLVYLDLKERSNRKMGEITQISIICIIHLLMVVKCRMGVICSTHSEENKCVQNLHLKTGTEHQVGDVDVDGRIILNWIIDKCGTRV
jgi:hypothetical protein